MLSLKKTPIQSTLFTVAFVLLSTTIAFGQEADAAGGGGSTNLIDMFFAGGWAMYPLAMLSIGMVGLTIYNGIMVRPKIICPPTQIMQLKQAAESVDIDSINNICNAQPSVVGNIFAAGMERINAEEFNKEMIQEAMEEASGEELAAPFAMINYLNVIASVAPMVGMLGTVSGMVKAFQSIRTAGGMADPAEMAGNISEALITTASGLIIAIPAMLAFFFFKNKYGKIVTNVTRSVGDIFTKLYMGVHYPHLAGGAQQHYEE